MKWRRRTTPRSLRGGVTVTDASTGGGVMVICTFTVVPGLAEAKPITLTTTMGPGVKLDLRHLPSGTLVMPEDIDAALGAIDYTLKPFDIVLMNTVAADAYGRDDYVDTGIGFGRAATLHLTNQGVRVVGTDAWGWDLPIPVNRANFEASGDPSIVWEGHKAGADVAYCQIEKLQHLETLPSHGFTVACFPAKVRGASAGWTRAVAIFED